MRRWIQGWVNTNSGSAGCHSLNKLFTVDNHYPNFSNFQPDCHLSDTYGEHFEHLKLPVLAHSVCFDRVQLICSCGILMASSTLSILQRWMIMIALPLSLALPVTVTLQWWPHNIANLKLFARPGGIKCADQFGSWLIFIPLGCSFVWSNTSRKLQNKLNKTNTPVVILRSETIHSEIALLNLSD